MTRKGKKDERGTKIMPFAFFKRQSVAVALDEDLSWFSYKRLICNNVGAIYVGVS